MCSDSLQNTHKDKLHYHRSSVYKDVIILGEEEVTTILNYLRNLKQVLLLKRHSIRPENLLYIRRVF